MFGDAPDAEATQADDAMLEAARAHRTPLIESGSMITTLPYVIHVARGLAGFSIATSAQFEASAHRYAFIVDETVNALHRAVFESSISFQAAFPPDRTLWLTVPPGEREKSRERWAQLTDAMLLWGAGRDTTIIAIGGGVVCDLAGFVAATFMRGVPIIQVPTTLLAMVDASVGGKTGVDTAAGKNLVGAFHNPSAVVVDPDLLGTLPGPIFRSGLAEMLKHGVLADANYFDRLYEALPELAGPNGAGTSSLPQLIHASIAIKAAVVLEDPHEKARRHTLNFGHTIAHAIEQQARYEMLHGDAVAIGMIVESEIAERMQIAEPGTTARIRDAVDRAGLPTGVPASIELHQILAATYGDKKVRSGVARYALPLRVGAMASANGLWSVAADDGVVLAALQAHRASAAGAQNLQTQSPPASGSQSPPAEDHPEFEAHRG